MLECSNARVLECSCASVLDYFEIMKSDGNKMIHLVVESY